MIAYCCECGGRVAQRLEGGQWMPGKCSSHPDAKRMSPAFVANRFTELRLATGAPARSARRAPALFAINMQAGKLLALQAAAA